MTSKADPIDKTRSSAHAEAMEPLETMSGSDVKGMAIDDLIARMDAVRDRALEERYTAFIANRMPGRCRVRDIMETRIVRGRPAEQQRAIADAAFRFLLQLDLLWVNCGIMNKTIYGPTYDVSFWKRPSHWMKYSVLAQYSIVGSRIALECFFDLIHLADTGERMRSRSKFKTFGKWAMRRDNLFSYFALHVVEAFAFARAHRDPEVHGTSRFAHCLLTLREPDRNESNLPLQLLNLLGAVWSPLIEILNGVKPHGIQVDDARSLQFMSLYRMDDDAAFSDFLEELLGNGLRQPGS